MSKYPGEELVVTLFADVHYYISAPDAKPKHDRFEKGSYVYIYKNSSNGRGRLEIANNAGTPEVDSFFGFLDESQLRYDYKQPSLLSVTITAPDVPNPTPANIDWRLPTPDPSNQGRYMYRLNTIDIYFWTKEDSISFLQMAKTCMSPETVQVIGNPPPPQVAPVIQQLEQVAISSPSQRSDTSGKAQTPAQAAPSIPPPPPIGARTGGPPGGPSAGPGVIGGAGASRPEQTNFAPMGYNPSAPAAPESRIQRVKTPPPADGVEGTGLATAAQRDSYPGVVPPPPPSQPGVTNQTLGIGPFAGGQVFTGPPAPGPPPGLPGLSSPQGHTPFGIAGATPPQNQPQFASPPPRTGSGASYGTPYVPPPPPGVPGQPAAPNTFGKPSFGPQFAQQPGQQQYGFQQAQQVPAGYPQPTPPPLQGYPMQQPGQYEMQTAGYPTGQPESSQQKPQKTGAGAELAKLEAGLNRFFKKVEKRVG